MVMPQPGNQTRFIGAADLFDRIKACNFLGTRPPRAVARSHRAGFAPHRWRLCSTALHSVVPASSWVALESLQTALIEIASPDYDLVGITNVIDCRDLTAGKLFAVLMGQYLQFELSTVCAALGA